MKRINRRIFLQGAAAATAGGLLIPRKGNGQPMETASPTIDKLISDGARMMWIAAHPDDESMAGALLAKAGPGLGNPLYFLVLTHGEGGACCIPGGCHPDLATVRHNEMVQVAEAYGAELQHERLFNAPMPGSSFPTRDKIAEIWQKEMDVTRTCAEAIRRFKPDVLLTFDPDHGFTGHPEHQAASRFATAGVRMAADDTVALGDEAPHRVPNTYYGLNRYWLPTLIGTADPTVSTEKWYAKQLCKDGKTCLEVMSELTKFHRSQNRDMRSIRILRHIMDYTYLKRVDPFTEILDPFAPVA